MHESLHIIVFLLTDPLFLLCTTITIFRDTHACTAESQHRMKGLNLKISYVRTAPAAFFFSYFFGGLTNPFFFNETNHL